MTKERYKIKQEKINNEKLVLAQRGKTRSYK